VVVEWLKSTLRPGDVFWDVGANVGVMTLVAARRCARVVAFEPEPSARRRLEENIAMNAIANVTVMPLALGARDGSGRMRRGPATNLGMSRLASGEEAGEAVAIRAADALVAEGVPAPDAMKVDVEGAELGVFEGARGILRTSQLRAAVFETSQEGNAALTGLLGQCGFSVRELGRSDEAAGDGVNNFVAERA
jgi:FkbM family methyltransferase